MRRSSKNLHGVVSGLLTLCLSISAGLLVPSPGHAIPSAGNYVLTGSFNGNFTSNGIQLTAWQFNDSHIVWNSSSIVGSNDANYFSLVDPPTSSSLTFLWASGLATETIGILVRDFIPLSYQLSASVPEASTDCLLMAGLLGALGYGLFQRRQAEVQAR